MNIYIILIIYHDYGINLLILVTMSKTMNIIIILILIMCEFINHIIIIAYLLYFIQLYFLFQHTYVLVPGLKNGQINTMVNTSSIYNPGTPYQYKNGTTETISPIPSSPDRYIPLHHCHRQHHSQHNCRHRLSLYPSNHIAHQTSTSIQFYLYLNKPSLPQIYTYLHLNFFNSLPIFPILQCLTISFKI